MSILTFIFRSLWFYRKQQIALLAGTVISTAVLTGALIIGDSVDHSLRRLVDIRLGNTRYALLTGDRFVRADLGMEIGEKMKLPVTSLLMLPGIGVNPGTDDRIIDLNVIGIEPGFWEFFQLSMPGLSKDEAVINVTTAQKLRLQPGDELIIRVKSADVIPLNAPFAEDRQQPPVFRLTVKAIASDDQMGRFSLKSNQAAPFNVFVDLGYFSGKLKLEGLANTILAGGKENGKLTLTRVNEILRETWQLADAGLKIHPLTTTGKLEIISDRIFIDDPISSNINKINIPKECILTYLVNTICFNNMETPYSFVTAASAPLVTTDLKEDEIIIHEWLSEDLGAGAGDTISLDYYVIGPLRTLGEVSRNFVVKRVFKAGEEGVDSTLMPDFPGLAGAGSCRDWSTSIPIDLKRIRDKDEQYWDGYKGTPKALISIDQGIALWGNEFGNYTSFRFDRDKISREGLEHHILDNLNPVDLNLSFRPVYAEGKAAASNPVDFGELFLSLSFFIIVAGILITALLYFLGTESRRKETGVLTALGFTRKKILGIRMAESFITAFLGGVLGAGLGIIYNFGIMAGLNSLWNDAVRTDMLVVYIKPVTMLIGAFSGILIAMVVIWLITRGKNRKTVSDLLKDKPFYSYSLAKRKSIVNYLIMFSGFAGTLCLVIYSLLKSVEMNPGLFLSAGALFIIGLVAFVNHYLGRMNSNTSEPVYGLFRLSLKNSGRNRVRSITTISLLALGTFTVVITGANRKTYYGADTNRQSGTGGFGFWAETSLPVIYDLNTPEGKSKYGLEDEKELSDVDFVQLLSLDGDDASCLNLNQVSRPRILGIDPSAMDVRNAFGFVKLLKQVDNNHPWLELSRDYGDNIIPVYADQTVITWGLKKKVGDTLEYHDENGQLIMLVLAGGLDNSVFQGNILISKDQFRKHFPSVSGSNVMLIDAAILNKDNISELLATRLQDLGPDITLAASRLAEFNSVNNTYLTVFMALGGLGVLIGTFGLGIVILRNMLERRHELALLLALGYRKCQIFQLIFSENMFLLSAGMIIGILAAFIGVLPSLLSPAFTIPGKFMLFLTGLIFLSGMVSIWLPVRKMLRGNLMEGLRNE